MYVQAKNNFNSIIEGKLAPQLISANAEEIQKFFNTQGVQYSTLIPAIDNWNILGAIVSEYKSKKLAHHIYMGKHGKLAYLFQVDESYLHSYNIISLSDDLIKYLDEGNCYLSVSNGSVTLFIRMDNNICAVVSNGDPKELENIFCR